MEKGQKEQIIEKLLDVAIALGKLQKHDCVYYIDEIIENVAESITGDDCNDCYVETGTKATSKMKTEELIRELIFEMSEISDHLDIGGLSGDAVVLDRIRVKISRDLFY